MIQLNNTSGQRAVLKTQMSFTILGTSTHKPRLSNSIASYRFLMQYWNMDMIGVYESFKILFLDCKHRVFVIYDLSKDAMNTMADKQPALLVSLPDVDFVYMIVAHNCPAGNPRPSQVDFTLVQKLERFREEYDISVLDYLIINRQKYFSFADRGLL